ncbi:Ig-like domain-containing protein [Streptomyces sp. ODS05-4]|uniref:L,D-transpeptidase n=1 Tax=Streptomyces sp. ODS05-4 TaxID=2944939 RepID=UPI00210B00CA|nr:Ig-like domain-containing protein [Streptomyces sp. ODS05-4]
MSNTPRLRTAISYTLLVAVTGAAASACGGPGGHPLAGRPADASAQVASNTSATTKAPLDKPLEVTAQNKDSRITDVTAVDANGHFLAGELAADGARWRSTAPLVAGARYTVRVATEDAKGAPGSRTLNFETAPAKKVLKVEFGPEEGTYGVGQPLTAELSEPVTTKEGRAAVERNLKVRSSPAVEGSWYWVDDEKLHFRPKEYWPAGATVTASATLAGVRIGKDLYGSDPGTLKLDIGDKIEAVTDAASHRMTVYRNDEVINSIPVTTGKPGFDTRNGVKVVLGKEYFVRMRGTTVGIAAGSSEGYDLPVYYATRVTWSGEYVHAAPWSVSSHGSANVSHGCVGMSTGNAAWFYETVKEGDIVRVVNSGGDEMNHFGNGYGDWNLGWDDWQEGSAAKAGAPNTAPLRLSPAV